MPQEYFIPKDNIVEFTKALGRLLSKNKVDLINASIRIVRKDDHKTAFAYAKERFALVICFRQNMKEFEIEHTKIGLKSLSILL